MKKLNDEQLEMISGGYFGETKDDAKALYDVGLLGEKLDISNFVWHWISSSAKVDEAWAKVGITSVTKPCGSNLYFYQGRQISRQEAISMLKLNPGSERYDGQINIHGKTQG